MRHGEKIIVGLFHLLALLLGYAIAFTIFVAKGEVSAGKNSNDLGAV
jgi:predicted permease